MAGGFGRWPTLPMDTRAIPASLKATASVEMERQVLGFNFFWFALLLILLLAAGIYSLRYQLRSYVFLVQFLDPRASGLLVRLERHGLDTQGKALCELGCTCRAGLPIRRA
jgi:hypothetical protein